MRPFGLEAGCRIRIQRFLAIETVTVSGSGWRKTAPFEVAVRGRQQNRVLVRARVAVEDDLDTATCGCPDSKMCRTVRLELGANRETALGNGGSETWGER
jgi:hypothetical protein